MIKLKNKECKECGNDDQPLFSKGRCLSCTKATYAPIKRTPLKLSALLGVKRKEKAKPLKKQPIKVKTKPTGELKFFRDIWDKKTIEQRVCKVCGTPLQFSPNIFSHILGKGAYPGYRLNSDNIELMCFDIDGTGCHNKWDTKAKSDLSFNQNWGHIFRLENNLRQKYYREFYPKYTK